MNMVKAIKHALLLFIIIFLISCGSDPLKGEDLLKDDLVFLEKDINKLYKKNIKKEEILNYLWEIEDTLTRVQEGRDKMAKEADRLTKESYELNKKEIVSLKEARVLLYQGINDFIVCSYYLADLIKHPVYYHDRHELIKTLRSLQYQAINMVQRDPPLSTNAYSYYKNLEKITSQTSDTEANWYFTIEVKIGYNFNEKDTQTLINDSKLAMGGQIRSYFSGLTKDFVLGSPESEIKAGLVMAMNDYLIQFADFKTDKMEGIKLVTFDMVQYYEFQ